MATDSVATDSLLLHSLSKIAEFVWCVCVTFKYFALTRLFAFRAFGRHSYAQETLHT